MRELLRTGDLVRLSYLRAVLNDAGIDSVVLDTAMGSLFPSNSLIVPRLMVADDDLAAAQRLLRNVGESADG
jgi:hypothetical protein